MLGDETAEHCARTGSTSLASMYHRLDPARKGRAQIAVLIKRILRKYGYLPTTGESNQTVLNRRHSLCRRDAAYFVSACSELTPSFRHKLDPDWNRHDKMHMK